MRDTRSWTGAFDNRCESANHNRPLALIWPLLGRHIAFNRRLVDLTANVKAALFLSQTIYWTRHGQDIDAAGGWFLKTAQQWEMETGISPKELATVRERLCKLAILDEKRIGIPAALHFRLCVDQLSALLCDRIGRAFTPLDFADGATVIELLGPSLAYHRTLATIGGGVHEGLILSRALHLTRLRVKRGMDQWFCASATRWTAEIGCTRREQEKARRELTRAGLWKEARTGIPATLTARVDLECLLARLIDGPPKAARAPDQPSNPDCGVPADRFPQNGESRLREPHILDLPKAPNKIRRNLHCRFAESANVLIQGSTSGLVQPPPAVNLPSNDEPLARGGDLIFPETLLPEERAAARLLVARCGNQAQALLDELSARLQAKAVRTSAIAYLRGLVRRAMIGEFVPEMGQRVAAARRSHQEQSAARQQREAEEQRRAAERATPEYQAKVAERRSALRKLLDAMQGRHQRGGRS